MAAEAFQIHFVLDRARPPILTFGNSDGDQVMLTHISGEDGRRRVLVLDHNDADRECAYRVGPIGRLETARAEAEQQGWIAVSMNVDWRGGHC